MPAQIPTLTGVEGSDSSHEKTLAMNEALVLAALRQHELIEAANCLNAQLQTEINERKLIEKELHAAQTLLTDRAGQLEGLVAARTSELGAINKQLEAFVYSIAHDLRAPLRSMQSFSQMLLEDSGPALDETGRDYAHRINKSAKFMDALVNDLLAFSRISQQRVVLSPVSLLHVVEVVLSRLQQEIKESAAVVECAGPWPLVQAHESTLVQILYNLASNALKFITPGVAPRLRLRTEEFGGFIRFWVEDNGPGVPLAHQSQIFMIFTRLNGEKYPGTGIGLAIVQKGVERMGGLTGVDSSLGNGCRFWFDLKKAPDSAPPPLIL